MIEVVNLAVIENKGILLVSEGDDIWTLPGGKRKNRENELECLSREIGEELPGTNYEVIGFYASFVGETPRTKQNIDAKVYIGKLNGGIGKLSAEIKKADFFKYQNLPNVSRITKRIVESFQWKGWL